MKIRHFILPLMILTCGLASAQKKFSIEANYPIPMGSNDFKENYHGLADFGVKWAFVSLPVVRVGVAANAGFYMTENMIPENSKAYAIQPKAFAEFSFEPVVSLHPSVCVGYTSILFKESAGNSTRSGLNYNVGLAYDIIGGFFIQVQYDLITLQNKENEDNNVNILKAGVGIRF